MRTALAAVMSILLFCCACSSEPDRVQVWFDGLTTDQQTAACQAINRVGGFDTVVAGITPGEPITLGAAGQWEDTIDERIKLGKELDDAYEGLCT